MNAIEFKNVRKSFKARLKRSVVLPEISFTVNKGEIFGFLGPNGAGKSTSIKLLLNFIRPDKGSIKVDNLLVGRDPFQHRIGYLPETPCFFENLTGMETLLFGARASGMKRGQIKAQANTVLKRLNLSHAGANPIRTYSKGMKQRLGLAMSLIHDPDIYILDEPMSGLDPMGRKLITDVLLELRKRNKTVFFSSHILSDIERLCDRIGIINKGRMLFCGNVPEATNSDENMEDAFIRIIRQDEEGGHV